MSHKDLIDIINEPPNDLFHITSPIKVEPYSDDDTKIEIDLTHVKPDAENLMKIEREEILIKSEFAEQKVEIPAGNDEDDSNACTRKITEGHTEQLVNLSKKIFKGKLHCCNVCDYKTALKGDLTKHIRKHTGEKPFACNLCEYKAAWQSNLKIHVNKIHNKAADVEENPFLCNECGYRTRYKRSLTNHKRSHSVEQNKTLFESSLRKYQKTHEKVHLNFSCNMCKFRTTLKQALVNHMIIHKGGPFSCNLCDFKTPTRTDLRKHLETHAEKNYSSDFNECNATQKQLFDNHIKIDPKENPADKEVLTDPIRMYKVKQMVICNICKFETTQTYSLEKHMIIHEGGPFSCNLCDFKTSSRPDLIKHLGIHAEKLNF